MTILWIALSIIGFFAVMFLLTLFRTASDRRAGVLPPAGQATMADVEHLVRAGQRIYAIRCYREIHHCGLAEAKKGVDDLHIAAKP